jgi:hypothetical protein
LLHPLSLLVMTFFGLDGVAAAVLFLFCCSFSVLDAPAGFIHVGCQTFIMLAIFKDFSLLDLLEGCAPSLLVLFLCMFNAEVPLMPTLMQHGPLFRICELVASQQY